MLFALASGLPLRLAAFNWSDVLAASGSARGVVLTQAPAGSRTLSDGARIVRVHADGSVTPLTAGFHSAADPEISFDGTRLLFAGKVTASDHWQIFESDADGRGVRQITRGTADCRHPIYQSKVFTLDSNKPWHQVAFARSEAGAADLYSVKLDGSGLRRLTYNLASNYEPVLMPDGRMVFGVEGPAAKGLFGVNLDGTDYALFARRLGRMPAVSADGGAAVFVEAAAGQADNAGNLAAVSLRRPLRSYRVVASGLFHSPSALPDGSVLVSMRTPGAGTHAVYRVDLETGARDRLFDDPAYHDVQARIIAARPEPDGRSSVVEEEKSKTGKFYCLSVYTSQLPAMKPGVAKRVRVLDGTGQPPGSRLLGEAPIAEDGSFNIEIPANTPIRLQVLDAEGFAVSSTPWIWAKNRENRGCIGCHEDRELVPENVLAAAITRPSVQLTLPEARRRTVEFARDIKPLLSAKCANAACHTVKEVARMVKAGDARGSRLVSVILQAAGNANSQPASRASRAAVRHPKLTLTEDEKLAIIEWIDLGAFQGKEQNHANLARDTGSRGSGARGRSSTPARVR